MAFSFYGSEALRKSLSIHMDHALNGIITSSNSLEQHFQGWHVENIMALCGSFPSSGILRFRLVLSLIILRHCIVSPDSFEFESKIDNSSHDGKQSDEMNPAYGLSWGQPMGLFDSEDWDETYNNILDLELLLKSVNVTTLHPITRIHIRKQVILDANHENTSSDIEMEGAPTWIIPQDMEMKDPISSSSSSENNSILLTETLHSELQHLRLSIRLMQALSIYIRQYVFVDDEEEVDEIQLEKYVNFVRTHFQIDENYKSILLSMLQSHDTTSPKSRKEVKEIISQHPEAFNLQLFQTKLRDFIHKVNSLLPSPGFMLEPKSIHDKSNPVVDDVDQQIALEKVSMENHIIEVKNWNSSTTDDEESTTKTKTKNITDDVGGHFNNDYDSCNDFESTPSQRTTKSILPSFDTQPIHLPTSDMASAVKPTVDTLRHNKSTTTAAKVTDPSAAFATKDPAHRHLEAMDGIDNSMLTINVEKTTAYRGFASPSSKDSRHDTDVAKSTNGGHTKIPSFTEFLAKETTIESRNKLDGNERTSDATASAKEPTDGMEMSPNNFFQTQGEFPSANQDDDSQSSDARSDNSLRKPHVPTPAKAAATATQEVADDMENSVRDLRMKRSHLKIQVSEDPKDKSLALASQAKMRLKCDTNDLHSNPNDYGHLQNDKKCTDREKDQKVQGTVDQRNDENRNQRNQKEKKNDPSVLYANKRNRSQVEWDHNDDDLTSDEGESKSKIMRSNEGDSDSKKIKLEKIEHYVRKKHVRFTDEERTAIKNGVQEYGESHWAKIKFDIKYKEILSNRTAVQIKDAYRTMKKNHQV